jgi:hypothetical protein
MKETVGRGLHLLFLSFHGNRNFKQLKKENIWIKDLTLETDARKYLKNKLFVICFSFVI